MISVECREEEREIVEMFLQLIRSGPENYRAIHAALFIVERQHNCVFGENGGTPVTEQFLSAVYPECGFRSDELRCVGITMGFGPDHNPLADRLRELGVNVTIKPSSTVDLPGGAQ